MPNFNRRGFLQVLSAVGLSPLLPALAAQSAVAKTGVSTSKALWASLYANSGSAGEFVSVAKNMGLSNSAIQGVSARSVGVRMALATTSEKLASTSTKALHPTTKPHAGKQSIRARIENTIERFFNDEANQTQAICDHEAEADVLEEQTEEREQ